MSRVSLESVSNPSSTAARILAYMQATELSDVLEGPEGQKVSEQPSMEVPAPHFAAETAAPTYQSKLKYAQNADFQLDSNSSFPASGPNSLNSNYANSIPNTFKYKSHPNARTKQALGKINSALSEQPLLQEAKDSTSQEHESQISEGLPNDQPRLESMQTSTLEKKATLDFNSTPDWMPQELGEKWNDGNFSLSVRITKPSSGTNEIDQAPLFLLSTNTMIHNSKQGDTPAWKKASKQFEHGRKSQVQLQNIFASEVLNTETKPDARFHDSMNSMTSTTSTSLASVPLHLSKDQLQHLEYLLEQEGVPAYVPNPESPLKLFGDKYNTFTKDKLADVLQKMNKPPKFEMPDHLSYTQDSSSYAEKEGTEKASEAPVNEEGHPRYMIRNFTKSGSYSEQQFLQNANNIFNNIQKRGFKSNDDPMRSTVTSTPKTEKVVEDDYSSFTTGFNDDSSNASASKRGDEDYTSVGSRESMSFADSNEVPQQVENESRLSAENLEKLESLTFGDTVDETKPSRQYITSHQRRNSDDEFSQLRARLNELENQVRSERHEAIEKLQEENFQLKESLSRVVHQKNKSSSPTTLNPDTSNADMLIKWKRASQLGLRPSIQHLNESGNDQNSSAKGHPFRSSVGKIRPNKDIPTSYDNMVLDEENQRWVPNDKGIEAGGSLDSIEDLETMNDKENNVHPVRKSNFKAKQEVSFHLPQESETSTPKRSSPMPGDVTQISQLEEVTFTQTHKKLVALLTEAIPVSLWAKVTDVNLSSLDLESVKGLDEFLPHLVSVNIANNHIKFLAGLPEDILQLNASNNHLKNVASFQEFRSLQQLQLADNRLTLMESLRYNVHLNTLKIPNNKLTSLNGLESLRNLIFLDVSGNLLSGMVDFCDFDLPNLQEANLADNEIRSVKGIEKASSLRVLNLNDNKLSHLGCEGRHPRMKKLLIKGNTLTNLDVGLFPFLRVLRFDGNCLRSVENLHKLEFLHEISFKAQHSQEVTTQVLQSAVQPQLIDMSGNFYFLVSEIPHMVGTTHLILSAMDYEELPSKMMRRFSNLFEVNLNFNRLTTLAGLEGMHSLRKVYLVSNNVSKITNVISSLAASRETLEVLDLRLNPVNMELYPYVFSPHEIDADDPQPIHLETLDDIESFAIHYRALTKNTSNWEERDTEFIDKKISRSQTKLNHRIKYETLLVNYFPRLRKLDGIAITKEKRRWCRAQLRAES